MSRQPGFYVTMAAIYAAIAILGFAPTYWVPLFRGTLDVAPVVHLHALLFYGWIALFFLQTRLAATGRLTRHREFGVAGVALATGMCFTGLAATAHILRSGRALAHPEAARAFAVVPITDIVFFGALFAVALLNVRHPDVHKRLLLVATACILQAALGRGLALLFAPPPTAGQFPAPPPVALGILTGLTSCLLIATAMLHDRRSIGRAHPAYWYSGAAFLAVVLLRVPVSATAAWHASIQTIISFAP